MMENLSSEQILTLFEACLKTGSNRNIYSQLPDAWGTLFSEMYLSAEDLVDEMKSGKHKIGEKKESMLREFIRADCASGGAFVKTVIKKGGKIDRAALIMIADLECFGGVEVNGTTAIHQLTDACDKGVRPALIEKAGNKLLSRVYDTRGLPVLFLLFGLTDISTYDLDAIAKVFSKEDLRKIMNSNRTGKDAFTVFTEVSNSLKCHAPRERNKFFVSHAVKSTNMESDLRMQVSSHDQQAGMSGTHVPAAQRKNVEPDDVSTTSASDQYESLMYDSIDDIGKILKNSREPDR
ncbi:MAG: hypothetical protein Q7J03_02380 [Methanoregula sp.]|nr:hypothetical protein [Methanoregula sp.]